MGYRAKTKIELGEGARKYRAIFVFALYSTWEPVHRLFVIDNIQEQVVCGLRPRCIISKMAVLPCCSSVRRGNFKVIFSPDTKLLGPEKLAIGR